jgi:hypothetical protein
MSTRKPAITELHRLIDAMAGTIDPIVTAHLESEQAHAAKLDAQIPFVTKILEFVRPTVRGLGTRPRTSEERTSGFDIKRKIASWRGLLLTGDKEGPLEISTAYHLTAAEGPSGTYFGNDVFLIDDGGLVQLSYEGSWKADPAKPGDNQWRNRQHAWHAKERHISVEVFCREYSYAADPKKLAEHLLEAMRAAGDRRKASAKAFELADKYRAIALLL